MFDRKFRSCILIMSKLRQFQNERVEWIKNKIKNTKARKESVQFELNTIRIINKSKM